MPQLKRKKLPRAHLEQCLAGQPDSRRNLRNRVLLSLSYDLFTSRLELVALMTDDIEFRKDGTLRAIIRRSKASPFGMDRIASTSRRSAQLLGAEFAWRGGGWSSTNVLAGYMKYGERNVLEVA